MPKGDRTGPMGFGQMTGRGAGFCAGYPLPGNMNPIACRGFGRGGNGRGGNGRGGNGRGRRNLFYATGLTGLQRAELGHASAVPYAQSMTKELELESLKNQAEYFKNALEQVSSRLEELEANKKEK